MSRRPIWTGDGKQLIFSYGDHGSAKIAAIDLAGKMRVLADGVGGSRRDPTVFGRLVLRIEQRAIRLHPGQRIGASRARHRNFAAAMSRP